MKREEPNERRLPHLLFIVGPTASGKSDLAVEIAAAYAHQVAGAGEVGARTDAGQAAEHLSANVLVPEIINCDSVQFFDGVEIGAAKPGRDLLERVRHHLVGHVPIGASYTAGDFRRDALAVIEGRLSSKPTSNDGHTPNRWLVVGGSGFYVQALEKGMYDVPEIPESIRTDLEKEADSPGGAAALYRELVARDPEAAQKIASADRYRIVRALEILRTHSGGTLTEIRARFSAARPPAPFTVSKLGVFFSREELRRRVTERTRRMLASGLIEEVEGLRAKLREIGLQDWAPLRSVGYNEVQNVLDGSLSRSELEAAIVTSTMQLAKRQMTWFKRDSEIRWYQLDRQSFAEAVAGGLDLISWG